VELRDLFRPAIPPLVELLGDGDYSVQSAAMSALTKLAEYGESRPYATR
jgi:HEAT repeat protein